MFRTVAQLLRLCYQLRNWPSRHINEWPCGVSQRETDKEEKEEVRAGDRVDAVSK